MERVGKRTLELAPAQALFVHGEAQPAFLEERSARIVSVPDAGSTFTA